MKEKEIFNSVIAALGTGLTYLFGSWDTALIVLVIFMAIDYITGLMRATVNKEVSSSVGFKGLTKKFAILLVIIVAVLLDRLTGTGKWVFRTLVAYFYIANEGISILENSAALGLPVPDKLKDVLAQLKDGKKSISEEETKNA